MLGYQCFFVGYKCECGHVCVSLVGPAIPALLSVLDRYYVGSILFFFFTIPLGSVGITELHQIKFLEMLRFGCQKQDNLKGRAESSFLGHDSCLILSKLYNHTSHPVLPLTTCCAKNFQCFRVLFCFKMRNLYVCKYTLVNRVLLVLYLSR